MDADEGADGEITRTTEDSILMKVNLGILRKINGKNHRKINLNRQLSLIEDLMEN